MENSSPEAATHTADMVKNPGLRAVRDGIDPTNQVKLSLCEDKEIWVSIRDNALPMVASFNRLLGLPPGTTTIGTEKDSGAD